MSATLAGRQDTSRRNSRHGADGLTERQREVYDFIGEKIAERGYGPTVREIGRRFDIRSPNGVMCHLRALVDRGLITRVADISRGISIVPTEEQRERKAILAKLSTLTTERLRAIVAERFGDSS